MGGFLDADGTLTKAAILDKATRRFRDEVAGRAGWQFPKGASLSEVVRIVGKVSTEPESENGDNTAGERKNRAPRNRKAGG